MHGRWPFGTIAAATKARIMIADSQCAALIISVSLLALAVAALRWSR